MQFLLESHAIHRHRETFSAAMTCSFRIALEWTVEPVMNSPFAGSREQIDRKTCRSICDAVGERLRQSLRPEDSRLSPRLQLLMDEMRQRDSEGRHRTC
jgi:hypothetical protein